MRLELHPDTPQVRHLKKILEIFHHDGILIYPTDSGYSLGCNVHSKKALNRLYHIKRGLKKYVMAILVPDFSAISEFAHVDNFAFRTMKLLAPGPYTFILPATVKAKRILDVNRPEIGIRMPQCTFLTGLYALENNLIFLNTAAKIEEVTNYEDPDEIEKVFGHQVDLIADMGIIPVAPTTVLSLVNGSVEVLREGAGPLPDQKHRSSLGLYKS
jgi:tRNA threonylcarbamoyl adenosine modification protein (Sua5/YciO/YrdC/YwlC family)